MIRYERQQEILKILNEDKTSTVKSLAKRIYSSESSVRRDLAMLEKSGYVSIVYGGVVLSKYKNEDPPVDFRNKKNIHEKDIIAKKAVSFIFDGASIVMDSSSTVGRMCKYMKNFKNLKIITNSLQVLSELEGCGYELFCTGGKYSEKNKVFVGEGCNEFLNCINADLLFFSSQAISKDGEITDSSEEETTIRKTMIKRAEKKIFLCDYSKFGNKKLFKLCDKNDIDEIICNEKLIFE